MSTTTTGEMPNSNLTWESTTQVNAGLDMGLADDRVRVSFDYYDKVTRNLLFDVTLPNTTGYGSVVSNVGKVRFYGRRSGDFVGQYQPRRFHVDHRLHL